MVTATGRTGDEEMRRLAQHYAGADPKSSIQSEKGRKPEKLLLI